MATAQQIASAGVYATDNVGIEVTDGTSSRVLLGLVSGTNGYGLKVVSADGTTVIIDGTSNMFKIAATGTLAVAAVTPTPVIASSVVTLSTGLSYIPMVVGAIQVGTTDYPVPRSDVDMITNTTPEYNYLTSQLVNTNQTRVTALVSQNASIGASPARTFRYYVLSEAAV